MSAVLESVREILRERNVTFREIHHQPTFTSEESARARGEDVKIGGKAILMKVGAEFKLFVLSASLKVDSKAIKEKFGVKKMRFATREELADMTGLVPGCVPPFGRPILDFDLYIDQSIVKNEKIAFNAGSLTDSIVMSVEDYMRVAVGDVFGFGIPG
ncbi:MAG: YbaK/EbsC family protein [Candidatus Zixiibacteriota bacterium]